MKIIDPNIYTPAKPKSKFDDENYDKNAKTDPKPAMGSANTKHIK